MEDDTVVPVHAAFFMHKNTNFEMGSSRFSSCFYLQSLEYDKP